MVRVTYLPISKTNVIVQELAGLISQQEPSLSPKNITGISFSLCIISTQRTCHSKTMNWKLFCCTALSNMFQELIRDVKHVVLNVPLGHTWLEYVKTIYWKKMFINKKSSVGHIHSFCLGHFRKYFKFLEKEITIDV